MNSKDVITALKSFPPIVAICGDRMYSYSPIKEPSNSYLYFIFNGRERTMVSNSDTLRITINSKDIEELEILEDLLIEAFELNFINNNYQSIFISSSPQLKLDSGLYAIVLRFKVWQTV